jgi:hypothetical protein
MNPAWPKRIVFIQPAQHLKTIAEALAARGIHASFWPVTKSIENGRLWFLHRGIHRRPATQQWPRPEDDDLSAQYA